MIFATPLKVARLLEDSDRRVQFTGHAWRSIAVNPSTTTVYAQSAFYSSLRFTLSLQSAFYPRSAVCVFHWPPFQLSEKEQKKIIYANVYWNTINDGDSQTSPLPIFPEGGGRLYTGYISNDRKPEQLLYLMFVFYFKFSRAQFMRQVYARL